MYFWPIEDDKGSKDDWHKEEGKKQRKKGIKTIMKVREREKEREKVKSGIVWTTEA